MFENEKSKFYNDPYLGIFKINDVVAITPVISNKTSYSFGVWLKNNVYLVHDQKKDDMNAYFTEKSVIDYHNTLIEVWVSSCA